MESPIDTSIRLFLRVVLPTVIGFLLAEHEDRYGFAVAAIDSHPTIAAIALLAIIALVVAVNRDRLSGCQLSDCRLTLAGEPRRIRIGLCIGPTRPHAVSVSSRVFLGSRNAECWAWHNAGCVDVRS